MNLAVPFVDLHAQYETIRAEVQAAMQQVLEENCFILGPPLEAFERAFAAFCGTRHCIGVANGTDALQLIFRALDIGPGDEVLVPAMTFIATALGAVLARASPVLVDVRSADALLDPDQIAAAVTPRTKAIVPVHLYGRCADMDAIHAVAAQYGLTVIEDACQAHGATYKGRPAGALGRAAAFSFYPGKNLGAYGDGGAITTDDDQFAERLRLLRNLGSAQKYHHDEVGLNSRLDTLQAAVLSVKLKHLPKWNEQRRQHAAAYDRLLAGWDGVATIPNVPGSHCVYHLYVVRCPDRNETLQRLQANGIQAGIHYPFPLHRLRGYQQLARAGFRFPEAEAWAAECLSLPMYPELTGEQIAAVVRQLKGPRIPV